MKGVTKTLLISSTLSINCKQANLDLVKSTKDKRYLELMSMKIAFILQHRLFYSHNSLFGKRPFRWAKTHYYSMKTETVQDSKHIFNNLFGEKGVLCTAMEILTHMHEEVDEDMPSVFPNWFVQFCPSTKNQHLAYKIDCSFVRGALVGPQEVSFENKFSNFTKSLLRLRRTCFHSNLHQILHSENNCKYDMTETKHTKSSTVALGNQKYLSCSQPNFDLTKAFLDNSSKLQQLLNILHKDGGCGVNDSSTLLTVQPKRARKRKKRKKVLIILCFPEILRITSLVLNAVGISHDHALF